ncbi:MAG: Ig domain-containing protein [Pelovirga sp.]
MTSTIVKVFFIIGTVLFASSLPALAVVESMRIGPLPFSAATGVTVAAEISADRPDVSLEYRWFINDEEQFFETSAQLPGQLLQRGDVVAVEVTPVTYAGERLTPIVSQAFEAANAPPVITSEPPQRLTDTGFRYQVTATDPDDDTLTYRLEEAPENMTINAATGLIEWSFETMPEGDFPVSIVVVDSHDGQSEQLFELQMSYVEESL